MLKTLNMHIVSISLLLGAILLLIALLLFFIPATSVPPFGSVAFGDGTEIIVEIADTPTAQIRGLSGRNEIEESFGLLFLFQERGIPVFWMKGMSFPIDIIWINGDRVADIDANLPIGTGAFFTQYASDEPINRVLEVKAGFAARRGLKIGDRLDIRLE